MNSTDVSIARIRRACQQNDVVAACSELHDYLFNLLNTSYFLMAKEMVKAINGADLPLVIARQTLFITRPWATYIGIARKELLLKATQSIAKSSGKAKAKDFYFEFKGKE